MIYFKLYAVDSYWERCKFTHLKTGKYFELEWKEVPGYNVTQKNCQGQFRYLGDWNANRCGISFNARPNDSGEWKCDVERYRTGRKLNRTHGVITLIHISPLTVQSRPQRSIRVLHKLHKIWKLSDCPTYYVSLYPFFESSEDNAA